MTKRTINDTEVDIRPLADLRRADLCEADLRRADLRRADLRWADLRWADLRWADLSEANLRRANLRRADLHGADLHGADLRRADLSDADLREADLHGADLSEANLESSKLPDGCRWWQGGAVGPRHRMIRAWGDGERRLIYAGCVTLDLSSPATQRDRRINAHVDDCRQRWTAEVGSSYASNECDDLVELIRVALAYLDRRTPPDPNDQKGRQ